MGSFYVSPHDLHREGSMPIASFNLRAQPEVSHNTSHWAGLRRTSPRSSNGGWEVHSKWRKRDNGYWRTMNGFCHKQELSRFKVHISLDPVVEF